MIIFAQAYGAGPYGASTYSNGTIQTSSGGGSSGGTHHTHTGGVLTNTGFDLLLIATLACALTFAALAVRFWKRPEQQQL